MSARQALIYGASLAPEIEQLLAEPELADCQGIAVADDCDHPALQLADLEVRLADYPDCTGAVLLFGEECFMAPDVELPDGRFRHHTLHDCMALLAGREWFEKRLAAGDHISTLGLLANWREAWQRWGFDGQSGPAYFAESTRNLVLLDSGLAPELVAEIEAFASQVERPYEVADVSLDALRLLLQGEQRAWRLEQQLAQLHSERQESDRRLADYAMIHDLISGLTALTEREQVEGHLLELFTMLCAPRQVLFWPEGGEQCIHSPPFISPDAGLCAELAEFRADHAVNSDGFLLAIERGAERFGVVAVVDIAFPERIQHYLNLAIGLAPVLGLAFSNARTYSQRLAAESQVLALNGELQQQLFAVKQLNQELESFTYSVSHDLRAPLRSLDGFSHILERDYPEQLDERGRHFLSRIRANAVRMGELIDDLLRLSRLTRGELHLAPVDLAELAQELLNDLRETDPERRITLQIDPSMPTEGDPRLLRAALENLLGNAWKYSSKVEQAQIVFTTTLKDDQQVFVIRDNGAGFDMAYADKLFTPFQRLHGDEFPGTGIGLATVQRIIQRHGGRIWAESSPGEGASFFFTLNAKRPPQVKE